MSDSSCNCDSVRSPAVGLARRLQADRHAFSISTADFAMQGPRAERPSVGLGSADLLAHLRSSNCWSSSRSSACSWPSCCRRCKQPARPRGVAVPEQSAADRRRSARVSRCVQAASRLAASKSAFRPRCRMAGNWPGRPSFCRFGRNTAVEQIDFSSPYDSTTNAAAAATVVSVYLCPTTVRLATGREGTIVQIRLPVRGDYRGAAIDYGGIYGAAQMSPVGQRRLSL